MTEPSMPPLPIEETDVGEKNVAIVADIVDDRCFTTGGSDLDTTREAREDRAHPRRMRLGNYYDEQSKHREF
ncbi:hypothetical protein GUJ93_ZPchr0001g31329 [Zizania palustris]|uniref:Uncharacterized protein n=1 Tax=Zizania palustris TaxID=103762 RepID=A0A8J5RQQ2_ZIZPA|nr:hypothetical protein GUJ93_ZPchr0001g31329 [Zizania palustris]